MGKKLLNPLGGLLKPDIEGIVEKNYMPPAEFIAEKLTTTFSNARFDSAQVSNPSIPGLCSLDSDI